MSFTHLTIKTLILAVETSFSRWSVDFHPHACNKIFGIKIDLSNGQTTTFKLMVIKHFRNESLQYVTYYLGQQKIHQKVRKLPT